MEKYNKKIATNDDIEMVMVSLDSTEDKALAWAKKESFPWTIVNGEKFLALEKTLDFQSFEVKAVPTYLLVDENGKLLATEAQEVFKKVGIN